MPLETATYINELNAANPLGSDPIAAGDDHLRLIKAAVKATFPNITGPMTVSHADINSLVPGALQRSGGTMTGALVLAGAPTVALNPATKQYVDDADALKANAATTISAGTGLSGGGSLAANRTLSLANTAVTPGSYTNANITVDAQGRITAAANGSAGSGGGGTVTSVATGNGLSGGTITSSGTISLAAPGANTVGSYALVKTNGDNFPNQQSYSFGSNYAAGGAPGTLSLAVIQEDGSTTKDSTVLSGTWKWLGLSVTGTTAVVNATAIAVRVA